MCIFNEAASNEAASFTEAMREKKCVAQEMQMHFLPERAGPAFTTPSAADLRTRPGYPSSPGSRIIPNKGAGKS